MNDISQAEVEATADRMYERYGTFDAAIFAAEEYAGDGLRDAPFWQAVAHKLRTAKSYLLGEES